MSNMHIQILILFLFYIEDVRKLKCAFRMMCFYACKRIYHKKIVSREDNISARAKCVKNKNTKEC